MPLVAFFPPFTRAEAGPIGITCIVLFPCFFGVLAKAERTFAAAMEDMKLDAEDIEKEFIDFVSGEDFPHHLKHVLPVRRVQAGYVPAHALLLIRFIYPTPVRMTEDALIIELQTVVADHRHSQPAGDLDFFSK